MKTLSAWLNRIREYSEGIGYCCDSCGAELFHYPKIRICERCDSEIFKNDERVCEKCGRNTVAEGVCTNCKRAMPHFTRAFSPFIYEGRAASLINVLKNGNPRLAHFFGMHMADCAVKGLREETFYYTGKETVLLVPVPITPASKIERGYNQSQLLCKVILERLTAMGVSAEMRESVLKKHRETARQKDLGSTGRMKNVAGAYRVAERAICRDRIILLVDDILTTGATGNECAIKLLSAGAKAVFFITACSLKELKT